MNAVRVLVAQNGARHGYAVPFVLAKAGILEKFYTDACGNAGLGRWLSLGRGFPYVGRHLKRLHERRLPPAIVHKTVSFLVGQGVDSMLAAMVPFDYEHRWIGRRMVSAGFGDANLIYSSLGWGYPFLEQAGKRGITVVTEFYMRPSIWETYKEERRAFPDWEGELPLNGCERRLGRPGDPCLVSDFVIVPSEGVRNDVTRIHSFPRERIKIIPYPVNEEFFRLKNCPIRGRVFYAGSCSLVKGIQYLAMAAERLHRRGYQYELRVAGSPSISVMGQSICRHLTFLGRTPRTEIWREYQKADVFVLPSLSEGSASVTYEALAAGVPVITTSAAGSVVRDSIEGRIVPERDPEQLADAIEQLVEDRPLRNRMAAAARRRAEEFTWECYGERLVAALHDMQASTWR